MKPLIKSFLSILVILILMSSGFYFFSFTSKDEIRIGVTTSLENSGFLDYLISDYERDNPDSEISYTARGTGAIIKLAMDGEVDAIIVHAPELEKEFLDGGFGVNRTTLWYNYFILVGPPDDPANVNSAVNVSESFQRIKNSVEQGNTYFVSRGDESGTHLKEKSNLG